MTLNTTKVKYTINFQIVVQNKTQITSNTHRYKKIVTKTITRKSNHIHKLMYQKMSHVIFLIKNRVIKKFSTKYSKTGLESSSVIITTVTT